MAVLVLLNNFLHDFFAAGWLFTTIILWTVLRTKNSIDKNSITAIKVIKTSLTLMRFSLAGIIIFGIFRALAYRQYEWSSKAGQSQITLLIVKHIILLAFVVLGVMVYLKAKKTVKQ